MPQNPSRKREYAKERWAAKKDELRAKGAEWRFSHREHLQARNLKRRLEKRAMCLVAAARIRARKKGIAFSIDEGEVALLQRVIDAGRCQLSGVSFTLGGPRSATSPSLDRVVPSLGYVTGNLRIVCHALNAGMGDWGEDELRRIANAWIVPQVAAEFITAVMECEP